MGYPTYTKYKSTRWDEIGRIPSEWEARRLKFAVSLRNNKIEAENANLEYVGLENIQSWTGKRIENETSFSEGIASKFELNDILFGKLRPYLAKAYLAEREGMATTEALVLKSEQDLEPAFLKYAMLSHKFIDDVSGTTYGAKMPRANWDSIGSLPILIPSLTEQQKIADFLDWKTAQIDTLIAKKKQLIEKLREKRIALITRAVTKGLDPDAPMRDSGIPWLREVPAHWEVKRLRFGSKKIEQGWSPQCDNHPADIESWGVMKVGCVNGDMFDQTENKSLPPDSEVKSEYELHFKDILISRANTKALLGSAAIVPANVRPKLLLCDKLFRVSPEKGIDEEFLTYFLRTPAARFQYEREATGASGSMQNIGQDTIKNIVVVFPPYEDQCQIVQDIQAHVKKIDELICLAEKAIDRLTEYRTALITAATTGKIDVRNIRIPKTDKPETTENAS